MGGKEEPLGGGPALRELGDGLVHRAVSDQTLQDHQVAVPGRGGLAECVTVRLPAVQELEGLPLHLDRRRGGRGGPLQGDVVGSLALPRFIHKVQDSRARLGAREHGFLGGQVRRGDGERGQPEYYHEGVVERLDLPRDLHPMSPFAALAFMRSIAASSS